VAIKDAVVSLVLRAKNAISPEADPAAESLEKVTQEAEKLEAELKDLEKQQEAARGWKEAEENADKASKALTDTVTAYEKVRAEGKQAGQTQAEYAIAVRQARAAQSIATTEYNRSQRELAKYSRTVKAAGLDTNDLGQAEDRIQKELDQTQSKLNQATAEAREHGEALERASQQGGRFGSAMDGVKGKLLGLLAGVGVFQTLRAGITKLITAGSDLEELERQFSSLYGSTEEARQVLSEVDRIAERNSQSLADTAAAARRLKVAGIDPLNGSLQSLIDANAKYGSGAQTLDTVITQLGQAWQSGRLQLEELNSITDSGIPIMEALGNVTGRAGAEIRQMASDGELGTDVLAKLIEELGRMSDGAGADRAENFTGILESLRKEFTDFFALAANSGALDSLKSRMQELLTTLREGAEDGSINTFAQNVSKALEAVITITEKVVAASRIGINVVTGLWRAAATSITHSAAAVAGGLSNILSALGSDELAADLQAFADKAQRTGQEFADGVKQDYQDIKSAGADLFGSLSEEAEKSAEAQKKASSDSRDATVKDYDSIVAAAVEAGEKQKQATDKAAQAARAQLGQALKELNLDLGALTGGFSQVEQEAITRFDSIAQQIKSAGLEGEQSAKVLLEAFRSAMQSIDSEAGRAELIRNLDQALKDHIITQEEYTEALREVAAATDDVLASTQKAIETSRKTTELAIGAEKERAGAARQTAREYERSGDAAEAVGDKAAAGSGKAGSAAAALIQIFQGVRSEFEAAGEGASALFDRLYREQTDYAVMSVGSWLETLYSVRASVQKSVTDAQASLNKAMAAQNGDLGTFIHLAGKAQGAARLLGSEQLTSLRAAISSAQQQLDSMADSARSTTESLRTELIQMNGTAQEVERRRYEERRAQLQRQADEAGRQGASEAAREYAEALRLNEQVYQERLRELKEEERRAEASARAARFQEAQQQRAAPQSSVATESPAQRVELALPTGGAVNLAGDPDDVNRLLDFLGEAGLRTTQ